MFFDKVSLRLGESHPWRALCSSLLLGLLHFPAISQTTALPTGQATINYPTRPVMVIVTMAPGGTTDIVGRLVAQKLQESLGGSFVVENRAGAGGNIGATTAARAAPDGHTLMVQLSSTQVINPALYKATGFDPIRDFAPISTLVKVPYALTVPPRSDVRTVRDLLARAQGGRLQYGSAGNGTPNHLLGELLASTAGVRFEHIPYKGAAAATQATAAGEVAFSFGALPTVMGQIKGGQVRAVAVTSTETLAVLPDVPTLSQTVTGFSGDAWVGLFAPAGTPPAIVERLNAEVRTMMRSPEFRDRLLSMGATPFTQSPAEFLALIRAELPLWAEVVRRSGASID